MLIFLKNEPRRRIKLMWRNACSVSKSGPSYFWVCPWIAGRSPWHGRGGVLGWEVAAGTLASVILSTGYQSEHFVSNTLRGREISAKIKRLQTSKNHKNHISSDKLLSRVEKTAFGVVCWEDRTFLSGTEALPFDVGIPRLWHVL